MSGKSGAQTLTWDSIITDLDFPVANDGNGTWNTTNTNWRSAAIANVSYSVGSQTVFGAGGTAGTITIDSSISALTISNVTIASTTGSYIFEGGSLTSNSSLTVNNTSGVVFNNAGNTFSSVDFGPTMTGVVGGSSFLSAGSYAGQNGTVALSLQGLGGSFFKSGAGTLILSGANTYSGTTLVSSGVLQIGNGGSTGSITSNVSVGTLSTLVFNRSNDLTFGNTISGNGNVAKSGTGTLTLTNANTYTGSTTINNGTLQLGNGGTTGSITSNVSVASGATLSFNRSNNFDFSNTIGGSGAVVQNGSGTVTLQAANTYSGGTTVNAGTLQLSGSGTTGTGALVVNGTGTLNLGGLSRTVGAVTLGGTGSITNGTLTGTSYTSTGGSVSAVLQGTGVTFTNTSGTTTLSGSNTYTGGTNINGGAIVANNSSALGTGIVTVGSGATLSGSASIGNTINILDGGTLALSGLGSGAANVTLASGSTLTGTGTYSNAINLAGVTVSPGNSPGTLTINNALTASNTTVFNFELNGADQTVGGGINDLIRLTGPNGNLILDGILNISALAPFTTPGTWQLFEYSGILTNNGLVFGSTPSLPSGMSFEINTGNANRVDLIITAVPEPSSMMLVILGTSGLAIRRRARR